MPIVDSAQLALCRLILADNKKHKEALDKIDFPDSSLEISLMRETLEAFLHDFAIPETYETDEEAEERLREEDSERDYRNMVSAIYHDGRL